MSVCNFTQYVSPNTCIGDSLATFNANFSALDEGLCSVPDVLGGNGTEAHIEITEQNHTLVHISTKNSFVHGTTFDYQKGAASTNLYIKDGTTIPATTFPYVSTVNDTEPVAIFSTISLTNAVPKVSLFWTASGSDNLTIYATNSAASVLNKGPIGFNGPVTSLYSSGTTL